MQFSDGVRNAVRYGYLYRLKAEKDLSVHACIGDVPDILCWLAGTILSGFVWDVIKSQSRKMYRKIVKIGTNLDSEIEPIFTQEKQLYLFYKYVKEFNAYSMSITEKQFEYIKEEIIADYLGRECEIIWNQYNRHPTIEEYMNIYREANQYANRIMTANNRYESC